MTNQQKSRRVAFYVRVSTGGQTVENQLKDLAAVAERLGWDVVTVFRDDGISGAKGREHRPAFDALLKAATRKEFEVVAAWSVDRLSRSLPDLVHFLIELRTLGVDLYLHQQGLDTQTPSGRAMFQICGVFAEFERAMLVERTKAGMARAREEGKRCARPPLSPELQEQIRALRSREQPASPRRIAKELGIALSTAQKYVKAVGK